jgi:hypothetical protein
MVATTEGTDPLEPTEVTSQETEPAESALQDIPKPMPSVILAACVVIFVALAATLMWAAASRGSEMRHACAERCRSVSIVGDSVHIGAADTFSARASRELENSLRSMGAFNSCLDETCPYSTIRGLEQISFGGVIVAMGLWVGVGLYLRRNRRRVESGQVPPADGAWYANNKIPESQWGTEYLRSSFSLRNPGLVAVLIADFTLLCGIVLVQIS